MRAASHVLPVYWASYLINADASGLEPGEQPQIDAWLSQQGDPVIVDCGEPYFSRYNDAGALAGDVCEYSTLS